jgi:hypothetical protein
MKDDWALVVGINTYPNGGLNPLQGAVRDAERFHRWVTRAHGGNVPAHQSLLLTGPETDGSQGPPKPVISEIFQFFESLLNVINTGEGRRLYVYLSGHGISPSGQESVRNAALLMANARAPNRWHNFPGNIWAEGARSTALFREVVLIMDCCRDLKNNAVLMPHIFGDPVADSRDCRLVEAYATDWASKARERPFPPDDKKQGVFTHSLLAVLDAGRMNGMMLKASVKTHLARMLQDEARAQDPQIRHDEDLVRIVFNEAAKPPRTSLTLKGLTADRPVIERWPEGEDHSVPVPLEDWDRDGEAWRGTLHPGLYEVRLPAGRGRRLRVLAGVPEEVSI